MILKGYSAWSSWSGELHPWNSPWRTLSIPDVLVFDLDRVTESNGRLCARRPFPFRELLKTEVTTVGLNSRVARGFMSWVPIERV